MCRWHSSLEHPQHARVKLRHGYVDSCRLKASAPVVPNVYKRRVGGGVAYVVLSHSRVPQLLPTSVACSGTCRHGTYYKSSVRRLSAGRGSGFLACARMLSWSVSFCRAGSSRLCSEVSCLRCGVVVIAAGALLAVCPSGGSAGLCTRVCTLRGGKHRTEPRCWSSRCTPVLHSTRY